MDSGWHSKFGLVVIESLVLVWSWFGEDGGGLTSGFPWLFMDWLFYEIPHSCLEYGTVVTG